MNEVKGQFSKKGNVSDSDKASLVQLDKYIKRINGFSDSIDQSQLKEVVQSVRKDATYGLTENAPVNSAVKAIGSKLDQFLKSENPDYKEAMKPVADATKALKDTVKNLG